MGNILQQKQNISAPTQVGGTILYENGQSYITEIVGGIKLDTYTQVSTGQLFTVKQTTKNIELEIECTMANTSIQYGSKVSDAAGWNNVISKTLAMGETMTLVCNNSASNRCDVFVGSGIIRITKIVTR